MEKIARKIEELLEEKLFLYQKLQSILEQEKTYIVNMDIDSLWKTTGIKNRLMSEIEQLRQQIIIFLKENQISLDMDIKFFDLSRIINGLPVSENEKSNLKKASINLEIMKQNLIDLASESKRYTNDYLEVINGIFATIAGSENKPQYAKTGVTVTGVPEKYFIKTRV